MPILQGHLGEIEDLSGLASRRRRVADQLRSAIVVGEMQTGVVYSAPALAAQFGVSATPVREAMIDLAKEGLVDVVRNKGFRVREPTDKQLQDMLDVRLLLEVPTVRQVARLALTESQIEFLRRLATDTVEAAESRDFLGHITSDLKFHLELLALADNPEIVEVVRVLRSRSRLYGLHSEDRREELLRSSREHLEIVEMVAAGNSAGAGRLLKAHISGVGTRWAKSARA